MRENVSINGVKIILKKQKKWLIVLAKIIKKKLPKDRSVTMKRIANKLLKDRIAGMKEILEKQMNALDNGIKTIVNMLLVKRSNIIEIIEKKYSIADRHIMKRIEMTPKNALKSGLKTIPGKRGQVVFVAAPGFETRPVPIPPPILNFNIPAKKVFAGGADVSWILLFMLIIVFL